MRPLAAICGMSLSSRNLAIMWVIFEAASLASATCVDEILAQRGWNFVARLAALVPRPRVHLLRYHGLFAPNAKHRDHIITRATPTAQCADDTVEVQPSAPMSWMQRLRRVFAIDLRCCARCGGGPVRVIAAITQPALVARILEHRAARDETAGGARAPPRQGAALAPTRMPQLC
jgi:hypothetical protein